MPAVVEPVVVPRAEHSISRSQIDPDALKVLYRLHQNDYVAYLVGGSVRDLLLGRRPKDFDIGTSAHPYQVKRLFRNCWIIGRRFRLAHVRFGTKTIEVATFRRLVSAEELAAAEAAAAEHEGIPVDHDAEESRDRLVHRDNTFGTPEEDAFRRDFTINALFYDIGTFSIIDYTGGLQDLRDRLIRCIGDPVERFQEDPVRMLRAVAMAARLDFAIDPPIDEAIAAHRREIARSAPARLMEEFYKLLRSGAAETRLPNARRAAAARADRAGAAVAGDERSLGIAGRARRLPRAVRGHPRHADQRRSCSDRCSFRSATRTRSLTSAHQAIDGESRKEPRIALGMLPLARRDVERLRQILGLQRRLIDMSLSPRAQRALIHRAPFREALTWLEIHGQAPEVVEHWRGFVEAAGTFEGDGRGRSRRRQRSDAAAADDGGGAQHDDMRGAAGLLDA